MILQETDLYSRKYLEHECDLQVAVAFSIRVDFMKI